MRAWQSRPLEALYPIVYFDCLMVKIRDGAHIKNKAVYLAIAINRDGLKEVLGLWIAQSEGAKFWLAVITELKNRGLQDLFIACVDGLKGLPEAIETVYQHTQVQLCIVHVVRNSLNYVGYKERKAVAADMKQIYKAATREQGELELKNFAEKWAEKYPPMVQMWRKN